MTKQKGISKRELVKEISNATELKTDAVMSVINCFTDIFIREVVVNEVFNLDRCFTVEAKPRKATKRVDFETGEKVLYPDTKVLSVRLSPKINYYFRWKLRHERNAKYDVDASSWKDIYDKGYIDETED